MIPSVNQPTVKAVRWLHIPIETIPCSRDELTPFFPLRDSPVLEGTCKWKIECEVPEVLGKRIDCLVQRLQQSDCFVIQAILERGLEAVEQSIRQGQ